VIFVITHSSFTGPKDLSLCCYSIGILTLVSFPIRSCLQLRASALLLSFLSVYIILNLYCLSNSDYRTYCRFNFFVVVKYVRFLWSKKMTRLEQLSAYTL
jgi:hypothetical protein